MVKTWMPTAGGILSIVAGGFSLLFSMLFGLGLAVAFNSSYLSPGDFEFPVTAGFWVLIFLSLIILSIVAIIGGVYALRRRVWGLALAGAICALLTVWAWWLGVAAIVLIAMSKNEFDHIVYVPPAVPPLPPPPPV